jgi:hypothetical protein
MMIAYTINQLYQMWLDYEGLAFENIWQKNKLLTNSNGGGRLKLVCGTHYGNCKKIAFLGQNMTKNLSKIIQNIKNVTRWIIRVKFNLFMSIYLGIYPVIPKPNAQKTNFSKY